MAYSWQLSLVELAEVVVTQLSALPAPEQMQEMQTIIDNEIEKADRYAETGEAADDITWHFAEWCSWLDNYNFPAQDCYVYEDCTVEAPQARVFLRSPIPTPV